MRSYTYLMFFILTLACSLNAQEGAVRINSRPGVPKDYQVGQNNSIVHSNRSITDTVIELKWDTSEPIGYMTGLSKGDTICVTFDGVPGGILDSVRIALARAGSIIGGVWQYSGHVRPSPFGKPLAVPITATITSTAQFPYPVPYQNWAGIDLRNRTIPTDSAFVVAFVLGQDSITPGLMVSKFMDSVAHHSFTYFTPKGSTPNWYYLTAGEDSIYLYLIRAYVRLAAATDVKDSKTKIKNFSLSQNYPNPFNPETIINYSLAEEGKVRISVMNILGVTLAVLVNKEQEAGSYSVRFNPSRLSLPSGVYFYSIEVSSPQGAKLFSEVRKLIYMK